MNSLFNYSNTLAKLSNLAQSAPTMNTAPQSPNLLWMAIGAALRHESPQSFMENLAQTHPLLKQYDLSNLPQTAAQICQQNGVDMQSVIQQIDSVTSSFM